MDRPRINGTFAGRILNYEVRESRIDLQRFRAKSSSRLPVRGTARPRAR